MTSFLESLRHAVADPITRHAMLVHWPIVLSMLAVPFTGVLVVISGRRATAYRVILAAIVFIGAVIAWQAGEAGEAAEPIVEARLRTDEAREVLHEHEELGEKVAVLMAATAGLIAVSVVPRRGVRLAAGLAATAAAVGVAVLVIVVAHDGGRLVHWLDPGPGGGSGGRAANDATGSPRTTPGRPIED